MKDIILTSLTAAALLACAAGDAESHEAAYVAIAVDDERLMHQTLRRIADDVAPRLSFDNINAFAVVRDEAIIVTFDQPNERARARTLIQSTDWGIRRDGLVFDFDSDNSVSIRLTNEMSRSVIDHATTQTAEVIRRRVENWPIRRVSVEQNSDIITVHAPGATPAQLRHQLHLPSRVEFALVSSAAVYDEPPPGTVRRSAHPLSETGELLILTPPIFTGESVQSALAAIDPASEAPVIAFRLNSEGLRLFCKTTRDHSGERFAVLLDDQIVTAPTIVEPICGGSGQIRGNFDLREAAALAQLIVGAQYPAPIRVASEGFRTFD